MDLSTYRSSRQERERVADLFRLMPQKGERALDIGARDGFLSRLMTERFSEVVALDLEAPRIEHPQIRPVKGDAAHLMFPDSHFDVVLCAEVLEHVPKASLQSVCDEICRVSRNAIVIGVPYKQDLRFGQTRCVHCGGKNPPWGHVNRFDEASLRALFCRATAKETSFVGKTRSRTNWAASALMDFAGNPYGTWEQEEACIHCGDSIGTPKDRNLLQKVATRLAVRLNDIHIHFTPPRGNWIHILFTV